MRPLTLFSFCIALAASASAAPGLQVEAGVSHFWLRDTELQQESSHILSTDEPTQAAPFIGTAYRFNDWFDLRLTYHYLDDLETVIEDGWFSTGGGFIIWSHYRDDVHLVSLAPEFTWSLASRLKFAIAPQLNWVASKGVVSYTSNDPAVLLVGPRDRDDDGFTLGGSTRLIWSLSDRAAVSLGYQYLDLDPSFGRAAHVVSGGATWTF